MTDDVYRGREWNRGYDNGHDDALLAKAKRAGIREQVGVAYQLGYATGYDDGIMKRTETFIS